MLKYECVVVLMPEKFAETARLRKISSPDD